jgi:hypothetical protein
MKRELKYGKWNYDEDAKELTIEVYHPKVKDGEHQIIVLPKAYIFSVQRFMTSVFQRMSIKRRIKKWKPGSSQTVRANIKSR